MQYNKSSLQKKRKHLRSRSKRIHSAAFVTVLKVLIVVVIFIIVGACGLTYGAAKGIIEAAPTDYELKPQYSATVIYDDSGSPVQYLSDYSSNRIILEYEDIPENLRNAFIAIEDERFYEHNGVDMQGIVRATFVALTSGGATQGASTITQQLIKNNVFDVGGESNFWAKAVRKLQEQYLAVQVERTYSKEEIITDYLNTINLGKGTLGVESAANYYFGKSASELTLSECAVLAAITKNPTQLNPVDHEDANKERKDTVLKKMYDLDFISGKEYEAALSEDVYAEISSRQTSQTTYAAYSYFTDSLITQVVEDLEEICGYTQVQAYNLVYRGGLRIHSTQSTELQNVADTIINDEANYPVDTEYSLEYSLYVTLEDGTTVSYTERDVRDYFRNNKGKKDYNTVYSSKKAMKKAVKKFRKNVVAETDTIESETINYTMEPQISYSLIDQSTGQIKVLVGGRGEKEEDLALNRATSLTRQPGSTFKILSTYAPALDTGGMTLGTFIDDCEFKYDNGKTVNNADKKKHTGLTTIRDAIRDSNNVVAVKTLTSITPQVGYNYLLQLGFTTLVNNRTNADGVLETDVTQALALGGITDGVTNVELTAAYAAIANGGYYNTPILYTTVEDSEGNVILSNLSDEENGETGGRQVMKETTAWLLTSAMQDVVSQGTGTGAQLQSDMAVAGKTGTTSNNYDYWFCGYTPYYTASIWTGYDYNTSFANDDDYHKAIWAKIMDAVIETEKEKTKKFKKCDGIKKVTICAKSGQLPVKDVCSNDPEGSMERTEYFAEGTEPTESCENHIIVTLCSKTGEIARKYCPSRFLYQEVFRVRPEGSVGTTDDSAYCLDTGAKCSRHTRQWKEEKKEKKKEEESLPDTVEDTVGDTVEEIVEDIIGESAPGGEGFALPSE